MGVDLALIIRAKLRHKHSYNECVRYQNEVINHAERFFHGRKHFVSGRSVEKTDEEIRCFKYPVVLEPFSFDTPFLNMDRMGTLIYLFAGYWCIYTGDRYWLYFYKHRDSHGRWRSDIREMFFDAVRMFGETEGWVSGDMMMDEVEECTDNALERWLQFREGKPWTLMHEFSYDEAQDIKQNGRLEYWSRYHDSFTECFDLLHEYQTCYPQYEILTIHPIGGNILIAEDDEIYLMNPDTGKFLTNFPIDGIKEYDFNSVTIYYGDEYAKYDYNGKKLTNFQKD